MVEMLGVLAIVGVLSVMGIAGYTTAMRSHKANEIVNATSMLHVLASSKNNGAGAHTQYTIDVGTPPTGTTEIEFNNNAITITGITNVALCGEIANKLGDKVVRNNCESNASLVVAMGEVVSNETPPVIDGPCSPTETRRYCPSSGGDVLECSDFGSGYQWWAPGDSCETEGWIN